MRKLIGLFVFLMYLGIQAGFAQTREITGTVIDKNDKSPLPGVTVTIKGEAGRGVATNIDGKFSLRVNENDVLVISFIGMKTQEIAVAGKKDLQIELEPEAEALDEVIVTGYGTYKKASFTGAASTVGTDKVRDIPSISVQDRLAGAVAGVQITSTSGLPGAVESVRIRGMGSMNAGNNPLYVIDGVPVLTGDASGFSYSESGHSILSTLNSNDIETMTVIKDAAAASLYGSRAANGVIVITTKQGRAGKTKYNFKGDWGFSDMAIDYRPVLNGEDRRDILRLGLYNYSINSGASEADANSFADRNIDQFAAKPWSGYTNWKDHLFRTGSHQNYEFSIQGGNEKTKFFSSLAYTNQEGITISSHYERITGRLNLTHTANKFTFGGNILFASAKQKVNSEKTSFSNPIMAISMTCSPSDYPYNEDGTVNITHGFGSMGKALANPLYSALLNYDRSELTRAMSTLSAQYEIINGLTIKEVLNYDFNQTNNRVWWDPRSNDGSSSQGVFQRYMINNSKFVSQTQLNYAVTIAEKHNIDALFSYEIEDTKEDYVYANGNTYPNYQLPEITNSANNRASSNVSENSLLAYVGRLNYNYDQKYYLSGSFRRDGTSRLSSDSRWGNFWSVSGSWRISQENFMKPINSILTDAKIRASYGVNGTQPDDWYKYMGVFGYGYNYAGNPGSTEERIANNKLKWEKNETFNIGIDLTFLNRFSATFEWYNRDTKDLLMDKPISLTTGFSNTLQNVGAMRNRGWELELKSTNIDKNGFYWNTSLNIAHNNNTLKKLDGNQQEIIDNQLIHRVNEPYYSIYVFEYAGVDPQTGKEMYYKNTEGHERETTTNTAEAKQTIVGAVQPKVTGGLTNYINWKFIDFNFTFTYSFGGKAYDKASWIHSNGGTYHYQGNVPSLYDIDKTWKKPGDKAELPQFVYGSAAVHSSRWLYDTDYVRLKNITLGISAPKEWLRKLRLEKARIYASATNILTFKSKDLYFDPETPADGIVTFQTPPMKTVTFGIEIGF